MKPATYRKYSADDIHYIREHQYDNPHEIAAVLGAPWRTVYEYMRRIRNRTFGVKDDRNVTYYALYLRKTDELVCCGSAKECAAILGIKVNSFYVLVHKILHGTNRKWDVYIER